MTQSGKTNAGRIVKRVAIGFVVATGYWMLESLVETALSGGGRAGAELVPDDPAALGTRILAALVLCVSTVILLGRRPVERSASSGMSGSATCPSGASSIFVHACSPDRATDEPEATPIENDGSDKSADPAHIQRMQDAERIAQTGHWDWNIRGNTLHWSDEIYRIFGFRVQEFGANYEAFLNTVHPDDRERVVAAVDAALLHQAQYDITHRIVRPDGIMRHVRERGEVSSDADGAAVRMIGTVQDVTEETLLAESEARNKERLGYMLNVMPVLLFALDEEGTIVAWNQECERVTGYSTEEILGNPNAMELIFPDERQRRSVLDRWMNSPDDFRDWETELSCRRGIKKHIRWSRVSGASPIPGWASWGVGTDVTERKEAEQASQESEAKLRAVFENSLDGIVVVDPENGRPILFNTEAHRRLGYTFEEFAALTLTDIEARESASDTRIHIAEVLRSGSDVFETKHHTKSGDILETEVRVRTVMLDGRPFLLSVWYDIAARKRDEELRRLREFEIAHVGRLLTMGEMAGTIAHQLQQPLTAIANYSELLRSTLSNGAHRDGEKLSQKLLDSSLAAGRLIARMRDLISHHKPRRSSANVFDLVRNAVTICEPLVHQSRVSVRVLHDGDPVYVLVDPIQIEQVLINLLTNSIEAVRGLEVDRRNIEISVTGRNGTRVSIQVSDTGCGLEEETRKRAFDPFFSTKPKGIGMGLAISRRIVMMHEGELKIASSPHGTTVSVDLPSGS